MAHIGHPLLGDPKYGDAKLNRALRSGYGISSQLLHSWEFCMPEMKEPLRYLSGRVFRAELPEEFSRLSGPVRQSSK
ncbi:MAG: hypothetical protein Q4E57_11365 [Eubacteriales bacterium]|nr:hypothetical protein [Eubacteriales bacterium]